MTTKAGPKEQQLRAMREAMVKRTEQNNRLLKSKLKMKKLGPVVIIKASKRGG